MMTQVNAEMESIKELGKLTLQEKIGEGEQVPNNLLKEIILSAVNKIREKKKRPDIDSIFDYIKNNEPCFEFGKTIIEKSIDELIQSKLLTNKQTAKGLNSFFSNVSSISEIEPEKELNVTGKMIENFCDDYNVLDKPATPVKNSLDIENIENMSNTINLDTPFLHISNWNAVFGNYHK